MLPFLELCVDKDTTHALSMRGRVSSDALPTSINCHPKGGDGESVQQLRLLIHGVSVTRLREVKGHSRTR